jgi:uncharacterized protein (TIGR02266 family)
LSSLQSVISISRRRRSCSDDNFYAGITGDIARGGLFIATVAPPPVGELVEMEIVLPDGFRFNARGRVRWTRPVTAAGEGSYPGCGIAWEGLADEALEAIRRFVDQRDTLLMEDVVA